LSVLAIVGSWLYYAGFESSSWQATPGKKVLNLAVTDMYGARISFGRASGRFFPKIVTELIPLKIGYILAESPSATGAARHDRQHAGVKTLSVRRSAIAKPLLSAYCADLP